MFVGGVRLLGLYQYGPDGPSALDTLRKHAVAVQDALLSEHPAAEVGSEWVVLQVAFGARKYTAKSFAAQSSAGLKPAELKFQPLAGKLAFHSFTATLKVHLRAGSLPADSEGTTATDQLRAAAAAQCAAYEQGAALTIDGSCVDGGATLSSLQGGGGGSGGARGASAGSGCVPHVVEIFAPNLGQPVVAGGGAAGDGAPSSAGKKKKQQQGGGGTSTAAAELFGAVTVRCVLHEKASVSDAVACLWQDLRASLRARLSMQGEMLAAAAGGTKPRNAKDEEEKGDEPSASAALRSVL